MRKTSIRSHQESVTVKAAAEKLYASATLRAPQALMSTMSRSGRIVSIPGGEVGPVEGRAFTEGLHREPKPGGRVGRTVVGVLDRANAVVDRGGSQTQLS